MYKKLLCLMLSAAMLLSCCAFALGESGSGSDSGSADGGANKGSTISDDVPGLLAGLKEGFDGHKYYGGYDEPMDATIAVYQRTGQGSAADIWWWEFCRQYFGINFKVTQLTDTGNYKSVAFMSGDMPDVFYQLFLDTSTLVEQGGMNGNLIPLEGYITPEIMPNLSKVYKEHPEWMTQIMDQEGHIYSLGAIQDSNASLMTFYINKRWLDDAGLELPKTLDEFTAMLEKFKEREKLPENAGKKVVPMEGDLGNAPRLVANAFGWITDSASYLTQIALKDGEPIFIYADEERFPEFMKTMKDYIDKGYFSDDVFDNQYAGNQAAALKASDLTAISQNTNNVTNPDEWIVMRPLTSKYNPNPQTARSYTSINCASFAISSSCDKSKIERLMKWADWLYKFDNYLMSHWGPSVEETEYLYTDTQGGLKSGYSMTWDDGLNAWKQSAAEVDDGTYASFGEYQNSKVQGIIGGYLGLNLDLFKDAKRRTNETVYKKGEDVNLLPFLVECYPNLRFFDAETNARVTELATDINQYVNEQYAAFISGTKELNEANLKEYFDTLKNTYNYEEYVGYFKDYYKKYKAGQAETAKLAAEAKAAEGAPAEADKPVEAAPAEADKPAEAAPAEADKPAA